MGQKVQGSSSFSSTARDAPELAALQQQALTLWSQKAPKLAALQQASSRARQAPELATATQQALMLQSLLLQRNKLSRSKAEKLQSLLRCSKQAPEPNKLRSLLRCSSKLRSRTSSGVCCVAAASSGAEQAPEFAALQQQALTL
jgi:hypothetical protein